MKGYKAFDSDLTCRGMQYEVGKEYTHDGDISLCEQGFHFCEKLIDCYKFYNLRSRICEVEAFGEIKTDGTKSVTNHIRIIRELTRDEIAALENTGKDNTGIANSGYRNSGRCNSGDCNSGDFNSGYRNSGNHNSGCCNSWNCNSGDFNSGYRNSGRCNSGDFNSGYRNSGDWNATNFSSGVLCTEEPECLIFDKPSGMTLREWRNTKAACLMENICFDTTEWVSEERMTDAEKADNPQYEILGGYLKEYPEPHYAFSEWWDALTEDERDVIKAIPNFDADKWYQITGIDLRGGGNE